MPSVADGIGQAAVARIASLSLAGATIKERAHPVTIQDDTFPLILVSVSEQQGLEPATGEDDFANWGVYTLLVVMVRQKKGVNPDTEARDWRQAIQRKLADPRWGLDGLDDVNVIRRPYIDPRMMTIGYVYTVMGFEIRMREARS